jgi:histidinol phosphatase-like PHP family hydrolase
VLEVLRTGGSSIVEEAIAKSGKGDGVARRRRLRGHFLSRARVARILADGSLPGVGRREYRGDLQLHSRGSDGSQSLGEIVVTARSRGYSYCAVTDHSAGLPIAGGMSREQFARQWSRIDRLNVEYRGRFRLLKGVEANIKADGHVDIEPELRRWFEVVLAAPHSGLRSPLPQTDRLLAAVRAPGVHILAHPRGRMYSSRPGVSADWSRVFEAAAESGTAIEIDGDPSRQDLDYTLAAEALAKGCLFALDSDAHGPGDWPAVEIAVAHARLAGIPSERIVNTWPVERLLDWAKQRSSTAA